MQLHALALVFFIAVGLATARPSDPVGTTGGLARGVSRDGVTSYLGIEYARAERWNAPGPAPSWEGDRLFDRYGPVAPQVNRRGSSEDCLFLNVWKPERNDRDVALPVLVWIHGGGFRGGSGALEPGAIVKRGVIVVSMNYRLGKLGFFDHASWDADAPRNFGMLDMVSALTWVQSNIAAFGGDPGRVTIAGSSAGGMGVQLMMVAEEARGLFCGALSQAGYGAWPFPQASCVEGVQASGDARVPMAELRAKSAAELVGEVSAYWLPFRGSRELPDQPIALFRTGKVAAVPYLAGANSYDGQHTLYGAGFSDDTFLTLLGDQLSVAKELYASDWAASAKQAAQRIFGDLRYVLSSRETARAMAAAGQPVYLYYYDVKPPGIVGAAHASEVSQVFADKPNVVQDYWVNFLKTGDPNGASLPSWEPLDATTLGWMVFGSTQHMEPNVIASKLDFLGALDYLSTSK